MIYGSGRLSPDSCLLFFFPPSGSWPTPPTTRINPASLRVHRGLLCGIDLRPCGRMSCEGKEIPGIRHLWPPDEIDRQIKPIRRLWRGERRVRNVYGLSIPYQFVSWSPGGGGSSELVARISRPLEGDARLSIVARRLEASRLGLTLCGTAWRTVGISRLNNIVRQPGARRLCESKDFIVVEGEKVDTGLRQEAYRWRLISIELNFKLKGDIVHWSVYRLGLQGFGVRPKLALKFSRQNQYLPKCKKKKKKLRWLGQTSIHLILQLKKMKSIETSSKETSLIDPVCCPSVCGKQKDQTSASNYNGNLWNAGKWRKKKAAISFSSCFNWKMENPPLHKPRHTLLRVR